MSETDSSSATLTEAVTLSDELKEEGRIDGQVKLYNVDKEDEFESDAEKFFNRTLMTQGLRESLLSLRDSLADDHHTSAHVLYGPYGSGKSHHMVTLYHCFNSPEEAGPWGDRHIDGFQDALPDSSKQVVVSLQNSQPEYLWEPLFEELDFEGYSHETGGYADMEKIAEAVGDETVVYLMDELEDWFESLDEDRKKANKGFLQALLEASATDDTDIYAILSVLREDSEVHDIINRQPELLVEVNMNKMVDRREVLHHRLVKEVKDDLVQDLVNGYVDAYETSDHVDVPDGLRGDMRDNYPFHPELLDALESRYFAEEGNQNTRGMIYLFSELLKAFHDDVEWEYSGDKADIEGFSFERDLITHGDIDAIIFDDELSKIDYQRQDAAYRDITERVDEDQVKYGRRIINTILLYSLEPGDSEGADLTEIVMGTFRTGDLIADIKIDLEQLYGEAWHLHRLNGKYAIREGKNPAALIENAAKQVSEPAAKSEIGDVVQDLFGGETYTVGFRNEDYRDIPDSKDIKVVVKDSAWTQEDVERVITDGGQGREWRNTFVFIQPHEGNEIKSGTGFINKARYIEGARQVLADDSLDEDIQTSVTQQKKQEESELRDRLEVAYGEVIDSDDPMNDWEGNPSMELDVFVGEGDPLVANKIVDAAAADPYDIKTEIWDIVKDLFERRSEASVEEVYEQFVRTPEKPIPGGKEVVVKQTEEALQDKPVLTHDDDGFSEDLDDISIDTVLLPEESVEHWTAEEVEEELRKRFGEGQKSVDVGKFEREMLESTDVWLEGEAGGHDVVMTAVGRLAQEDQYVLYSGDGIVTKARSDTTIRNVSDAERLGSDDLKSGIHEEIQDKGFANMDTIIKEVRSDESVYLPAEETEDEARKAVNEYLIDNYVLEAGGRYLSELGERDPTSVKIRPNVTEDVAEDIFEYVESLGEGDEFTVSKIAKRFDDGTVTEAAVKTLLLQNLGRDDDPEYVVGTNGSEDSADWNPGYPFRVPAEKGWKFQYSGDDVTELRSQWREKIAEESSGEVSYGTVNLNIPDDDGVPRNLEGTVDVEKTNVDLTLERGQDQSKVADLFESLSDDASNIQVEIDFER